MGYFATSKRKTQDVDVQGEVITLHEPSALDRTEYLSRFKDSIDALSGKDDTGVERARESYKLNCFLIAICSKPNFPDVDVEVIYNDLCNECNDDIIGIMLPVAEDLSGLKFTGNEDSQAENSQDD